MLEYANIFHELNYVMLLAIAVRLWFSFDSTALRNYQIYNIQIQGASYLLNFELYCKRFAICRSKG